MNLLFFSRTCSTSPTSLKVLQSNWCGNTTILWKLLPYSQNNTHYFTFFCEILLDIVSPRSENTKDVNLFDLFVFDGVETIYEHERRRTENHVRLDDFHLALFWYCSCTVFRCFIPLNLFGRVSECISLSTAP